MPTRAMWCVVCAPIGHFPDTVNAMNARLDLLLVFAVSASYRCRITIPIAYSISIVYNCIQRVQYNAACPCPTHTFYSIIFQQFQNEKKKKYSRNWILSIAFSYSTIECKMLAACAMWLLIDNIDDHIHFKTNHKFKILKTMCLNKYKLYMVSLLNSDLS